MKQSLILTIYLLMGTTYSETNVVSIKEVADAINDVRVNPSKYASVIQSLYLDKMNAGNVHTEWSRTFHEGRTAINEAITYLNNVTPLAAMELDMYISHCAWRHSVYQNSINLMTHTGTGDSTTLGGRVTQYGRWSNIYENIILSSSTIINTGTLVMLEWVIDDGVASRGHRNNIFADQPTKFGVGIKSNGNNQDWVTMDLVKGFSRCIGTACSSID